MYDNPAAKSDSKHTHDFIHEVVALRRSEFIGEGNGRWTSQ